jgi:hypothetical protein
MCLFDGLLFAVVVGLIAPNEVSRKDRKGRRFNAAKLRMI